MASKLATLIFADLPIIEQHSMIENINLLEEVLKSHGITDDLVEQHTKVNEILCELLIKSSAFIPKGGIVDNYIAAERKANRWQK